MVEVEGRAGRNDDGTTTEQRNCIGVRSALARKIVYSI